MERENFDRGDLLNHAVEAVLREPSPAEPSPDKLAELLAQVRHAAERPQSVSIIERIKNMKPMTRIAVAAAALIVSAAIVSWCAPHSGAAPAFAQVAEALNRIESASWKTMTTVKGPDGKTSTRRATNMFLAPSHERMEWVPDDPTKAIISIVDRQKETAINLYPATKAAAVIKLGSLPRESPIGRTFQVLGEQIDQAQRGNAGKIQHLDEETIDGRRAVGFQLQVGAYDVKLWADSKTFQPIRVEETLTKPETRIVMTDFQTGVELDKSLFSVEVPAGYAVLQAIQIDQSKKPIQCLAEALKMSAEFNGGVFPAELRGEHGIDGIIHRARNKNTAEATKRLTEVTASLGTAFGLLISMKPENDMHYAGKDAKLGTPDRPIFWYRPSKNANYQVLYADLSVKEVAVKYAPKTPEAEDRRKP